MRALTLSLTLCLTFASLLFAGAVQAKGISTHVLDLARGVGKQNVPVTLEIRKADGSWARLGAALTDGNGRVSAFGDKLEFAQGTYRLTFDMTAGDMTGHMTDGASATPPFFPEISVVFMLADPGSHYHVPVVVSPFGYSTYRGN